MTDLIIPDTSHWQTITSWDSLRRACPAIIIKAANDLHPDRTFAARQKLVRLHAFEVVGFYQYLTAGADPVACARKLQQITGPLRPGEFMVLDLEEGSGDQSARMDAWNRTIPGDTEVDYSGLAFWKTQLSGAKTAKHRWIAAYRRQEPGEVHDLWQYTDRQSFPGIAGPCDASVFHGSVADLKRTLGLDVHVEPDYFEPMPFPGPLERGDRSHEVAILKVFLTAAGFGTHLDTSTPEKAREFGPGTEAGVMDLQALHERHARPADRWYRPGEHPTGKVGPRTWAWLMDLLVLASHIRARAAA